jgi:putative transposase
VSEKALPVRRACAAVGLSRSDWYKPASVSDAGDNDVVTALNDLVARYPRWGFWKCFDHLRFQGKDWNHKRVWRVYRQMKLNLPRRHRRKLTRERQPLVVAASVNASWSLDFMHDTLYCGKRFRTLNVIDEGVRECLAIEVDTSLQAGRVIQVLERLKEWRGLPKQIRLDNGPELTSSKLLSWCADQGVELRHIQPGKPNQNAFIERFNRTFRHEVLNAYLFDDLQQVREIAWWWMLDYNEQRPHDALGRIPPTEFRKRLTAGNPTFAVST